LIFEALASWGGFALRWLSRFGFDETSNYCRDHFLLRNHTAIFSRTRSIHSARRQFGHARFARLFLRHRTHGHVLARHDRHAADRFLSQHDHRHVDAHLPGIPIAQMETVTIAEETKRPARKKIRSLKIG